MQNDQPKPGNYSDSDSQFTFHPLNLMLFISIFGLTMMFLALTGSYIYTRVQMHVPPVRLPWIFVVNTIILLTSSYTMVLAKRAYHADDTAGYQRRLVQTMWLSLVFMVAQFGGWWWLFNHDLKLNSSTTTGYLYVISVLHFLHVVAGLPFLWLFWKTAKQKMVEPVSVLVYFSDPEKRLRLRLLTIYWHFLDILWLYLALFFLVNWLIG
jgi:cytochrome c oxidase subunit III